MSLLSWRSALVVLILAFVLRNDLYEKRLGVLENLVEIGLALNRRIYGGVPWKDEAELERARTFLALTRFVPMPPGMEGFEMEITEQKLLAWVVKPTGKASSKPPVLLSLHSGGFALGHHIDPLAYPFVEGTGAIVVSPKYRLSPENKFPAAVDDCWAVLEWLFHGGAEELGGDPDRIGVFGASAGGNLAAVMAIKARDNGLKLRAHMSMVPMLQFGVRTLSNVEFARDASLPVEAAIFYWHQYLESFDDCESNPYCQPIVLKDATNLSPAIIYVGDCDILRDEGIAYYEKLKTALGDDATLIIARGSHFGSIALDQSTLTTAIQKFATYLN